MACLRKNRHVAKTGWRAYGNALVRRRAAETGWRVYDTTHRSRTNFSLMRKEFRAHGTIIDVKKTVE